MVEAAIFLPVFVFIVLGMLELAVLVLRYNWVSEASRQGARMAVVRGALAPGTTGTPVMNSWGPSTYEEPATDAGEIAKSLEPYTTLLEPSRTTIRVEWPDGDLEVGSRVRFKVTTSHEAFISSLFGGRTWTVSGTSTMVIAH